jgi:hypothetical protein
MLGEVYVLKVLYNEKQGVPGVLDSGSEYWRSRTIYFLYLASCHRLFFVVFPFPLATSLSIGISVTIVNAP